VRLLSYYRSYLLCYKNKTKSLVWTGGSSLSSDWVSSSDVAFYIDKVCFLL